MASSPDPGDGGPEHGKPLHGLGRSLVELRSGSRAECGSPANAVLAEVRTSYGCHDQGSRDRPMNERCGEGSGCPATTRAAALGLFKTYPSQFQPAHSAPRDQSRPRRRPPGAADARRTCLAPPTSRHGRCGARRSTRARPRRAMRRAQWRSWWRCQGAAGTAVHRDRRGGFLLARAGVRIIGGHVRAVSTAPYGKGGGERRAPSCPLLR